MVILYNGKFVEQDTVLFNFENRAFKFGDGFFESMRMIHGEIQFADLHAERIQITSNVLMLEDVDKFDVTFIKAKAIQLANKNRLGPHARFRLQIFRSGEGLYTPDNQECSYILSATPLSDAKYSLNANGYIIGVYDKIRKPVFELSSFKTNNALVSVLAASYKKSIKCDEVVILNQDGFICETSASNIFIKYQGKIYTPSVQDGCVLGVMRSKILQIAEEEGIEIIEAHLPLEILDEAEEIFLTNAVKGVQWVMGYGKKRYFKEVTMFFSNALNARIEIE